MATIFATRRGYLEQLCTHLGIMKTWVWSSPLTHAKMCETLRSRVLGANIIRNITCHFLRRNYELEAKATLSCAGNVVFRLCNCHCAAKELTQSTAPDISDTLAQNAFTAPFCTRRKQELEDGQ